MTLTTAIALYLFIFLIVVGIAILEYIERGDWKWACKIVLMGLVWPVSIPYMIWDIIKDRWYD